MHAERKRGAVMHTQAYLFRLLRRGTTIIVTTCSSVIGSPFCGKVLEEVGLIGMRHVVGGGHSGINVDEVVFSAWPAALDVSSPRPAKFCKLHA